MVRGDIRTRLMDGGVFVFFWDGDKILVVAVDGVLCGVRGNVGKVDRTCTCGGD